MPGNSAELPLMMILRRRQRAAMSGAIVASVALHMAMMAGSSRIAVQPLAYYAPEKPRAMVVTDRPPAPEPTAAPDSAATDSPTGLSGVTSFSRDEAETELARILRDEDLVPTPPPPVAELAGVTDAIAPPDIDMPPGETLPRAEILEIPEPAIPEAEPDLPRRITPAAPRSIAAADLVGPAFTDDAIGSVLAPGGRPVLPIGAGGDLPTPSAEIVRLKMHANLGDALRDLTVSPPEPALPSPPDPMPAPTPALETETTEPLDPFLKVDLFTGVSGDEPDLGYFMVQIGARPDHPLQVIPKDIFFVVDSSNSMTQRKLAECIRGLALCLQQLNPRDRFNVATFKAEPVYFRKYWAEARPEEIAAAIGFVEGLSASGQTDMYGSLEGILSLRPTPGRPLMVLLISDGNPTTGLIDSSQIINQLTSRNRRRISVYSFSGGANVNLYLLDLLAYRNRGESRFVRSRRDIPEALLQFYNEIADPTVIDLEFQFTGVAEGEIVPVALPHLFAGRKLTIYGRYPSDSEALGARIVGNDGERRQELIFSRRFDSGQPAPESLPRAWAAQKIYWLIGLLTDADDPVVRDRIARLSERYGVETPYQAATRRPR